MAGQQHQEYDRGNTNANRGWPPERRLSSPPADGLYAPIHVPRVSQPPMNLAHDDTDDGVTLDTASNSVGPTASLWSFQSMRDIHEFIREVNGRHYNAQNTTYFLPAGGSLN